MNKDDICEPNEIPKENWSEVLSNVIKSSIECADIIGDNLKKQCINYFELLETNRDEAYKLLDSIDEYMLVEQHLKLVEAKKLLERGK